MEYLIAIIIGIGLYFITPCNLMDKFKKDKDAKLDGGYFGKKPKSVKKKTRKKVAKVRKPKSIKRKVVKKKTTKRKSKK